MKYLVIAIVFLTGCSFQGEVDPAYADSMMACVDARDGERFSFPVSSLRNIYHTVPSGDTCADTVDTDGKKRNICNSMQSYLKCDVIVKQP